MAMHMQTRSVAAARPSRVSRVAVRASAQPSRVLSGFLAGAAALTMAVAPVLATATPVDLFDDRAVRGKGFDIIYEAREATLPQAQRDGMSQGRKDLEITKTRVALSQDRIDTDLLPLIKKNYWNEATQQLRRQLGNLRFDLSTLADAKPKADKKAAVELTKTFIKKVEALDFAIRSKDEASATKQLTAAQEALDAVLAVVL
mmetsp:Transcript_18992/g.32481  ORF Transcript_18992/g.32481 Transcript_18992/m.32481 type:complete len:202 (-) Transcript_18992:623-1228(-)|eukprot:CAMPEP_0119105696 /NCGR_PEP_ID=MMETSP1180-20130426/3593_1 /TAXON_ID=3052 ORGANISM="Chlamydomonas cf sp, Strain CCMP681" /NCGR_SAMPLE_ID=MMETSP1180 /ASSEMBLY_ACC=CAM_ASM_000741 /LENGTH=201 /DNA_ID=CAMNT_0007090819 /DNA_START=63 /DNA_END=668 /DNA_ORIENTATION=+